MALSIAPLSPKTIRIIGIVLACLGGLQAFSNLLSLLVIGVLDLPGRMFRMMPPEAEMPFDFVRIMHAMVPIAACTGGLGLMLLIGGLYLRKFKRWALQLVNVALVLMIIGLWCLPAYLRPLMQHAFESMERHSATEFPKVMRFNSFFFSLVQYFNALFWTAPMVTLLYLLNRQNTRIQFQS